MSFEFFFFLSFITSYSVLHGKNTVISAIEELAVKIWLQMYPMPQILKKKQKQNCIYVEKQETVFSSCIKEKWGEVRKCFPPFHPIPVKAEKGWLATVVSPQELSGYCCWGSFAHRGAGVEGWSSTPRDAPISLLSLLESPQKFSLEEKIPQLIQKCLRTAVLRAMHFSRPCFTRSCLRKGTPF